MSLLQSARAFCLPLIKGNRPICIKRDPKTSMLKVTLLRPHQYVDVPRLLTTIEEQHPKVRIVERGEMVQFLAPYDFDNIFKLIFGVRKQMEPAS
jgi:hypothetical protein